MKSSKQSQQINLYIPGSCVPKGRPRVTFQSGKAFAYTPPRTRNYAKLARVVAISQMNEDGYKIIPKDKPVRILIEFYLDWPSQTKKGKATKRKITDVPDIANLQAQMLDVLEGICYENDSQVTEVLTRKIKGSLPMTKIIIEEV